MGLHARYWGLVAGIVLAVSARAEQWFSLVSAYRDAAGSFVEIDLDTVRSGSYAVIRVTYDALQPHSAGFGFRSFVGTATFDCQRRLISVTSATYYALPGGRGARVGDDSLGSQPGMPANLLHSIPSATTQALLKAACAAVAPS